jgi:protein-tyrosine phosphatase
MIPLVDLHCHLLAGVDDGPPTEDMALSMCRIAFEDGTRMIAATAHQNGRYKKVTPERIRTSTEKLAQNLRQAEIGLSVYPCAEVMVSPDLETSWKEGKLLSMADGGKYLLVEMPNGLFVDLADTAEHLRSMGIRPILAHPERHEELLHDAGRIERLIQAGCLVQISASSVTDPDTSSDARALKSWLKRGIVHCIGSDGHSDTRRRPGIAAAYRQIAHWAGRETADRICSTVGVAVLTGLPIRVPRPEPRRRNWLVSWFGTSD